MRVGPLSIQCRIRCNGKRVAFIISRAAAVSLGVPPIKVDSVAKCQLTLAGYCDRIILPAGAALRSCSRCAVRVVGQRDVLTHVELARLLFISRSLEDIVACFTCELSNYIVIYILFSGVGKYALSVRHSEADRRTCQFSGYGDLLAAGEIHIAGPLGGAPANFIPADVCITGNVEFAVFKIHTAADSFVCVRIARDGAAAHVEDRAAAVDVYSAGSEAAVVPGDGAAGHVECTAGHIYRCLAGGIGLCDRTAAHVELAAGDIYLAVALPAGLCDRTANHVECAATDRNARRFDAVGARERASIHIESTALDRDALSVHSRVFIDNFSGALSIIDVQRRATLHFNQGAAFDRESFPVQAKVDGARRNIPPACTVH